MDIKFEETDGKLSVVTPYNPTFAKRAKRLGGRWQKSAWVFDLREREAVSQLCLSIWGTDTTDGPPTSVTLEHDTAEPESIAERLIQRQNGSPATIYLAGIEVAWCEDEPYARFGRAAIDAELKLHGRAMAEQHLQPYAVKVEVNCDGRMICSWLFTMPHKSKRDARRGLRKISARMRKSSRQVIDAPHMAR